ncbi:MAG: TolC family protein [Bacteroidales bacterium]|jgi:outer membrane protein TolC
MKKTSLLTFLFLIFLSYSTIGQDTNNDSSVLMLSLEEAKEYALEHNYSVRNASLEIKKAETLKWQTLASLLPQVNAGFDYQNLCGYEMNFGAMSFPLNPSGSFSVTAALGLSGQQIMGTFIQNLAVEMSKINSEKNNQTVIANVAKTYYSALVMEQTIDLLNQSYDNLKHLYEITENSVKVGVAEQTDADKLSVQVSLLKNNITNSQRQLEIIYNSLLLQLGCEVDQKIVLTDKLEDLINEDEATKLVTSNFDIERNYDYQLLKQNLMLSDKQTTMSIMNYLPTISAFYQFSAKTYFGKTEMMNMTPPNLVGFKISLPIFSSGINYKKIQESKLNYKITENNFNNTKRALILQSNQLKSNVISAFENYQTQQKNIDVSKRVLDNISNKYEYGRASTLDVTSASNELINAHSNYNQAVLQLINAQIELKQLLNVE